MPPLSGRIALAWEKKTGEPLKGLAISRCDQSVFESGRGSVDGNPIVNSEDISVGGEDQNPNPTSYGVDGFEHAAYMKGGSHVMKSDGSQADHFEGGRRTSVFDIGLGEVVAL